MQGDMTTEVSELKTTMTCDLKHGIVQPCGKLFDETRLAGTRGAVRYSGSSLFMNQTGTSRADS